MKNNHRYTVPMVETFWLLGERLLEANLNIYSTSLKEALDNIDGNVITIGCGGSLVIANYLSKALWEKGIFNVCKNARDIMYSNHKDTDSLFALSYSGRTHGIRMAFDEFIGNKYLITCNPNIKNLKNTNIISLGYENMDKEKSFI